MSARSLPTTIADGAPRDIARGKPITMSRRLLSGMTAALLVGGGLTAVNFATTTESTPGGSAFAAPSDQAGTCGPITVAYLIDFSDSFGQSDFEAMMAETRSSVESMGSIPGLSVNVKLIPFNSTAPASFFVLQGDLDYAELTGEGFTVTGSDGTEYTVNTDWRTDPAMSDWNNDEARRVIVDDTIRDASGPSQVVDASDSAAVDAAFADIERDSGVRWTNADGEPEAHPGGGNATNWQDALSVAAADTSITDVILMTDGVPNVYRTADGTWTRGSGFPGVSEDTMAASESQADVLMAGPDGVISTDDDVNLYAVGVNGAYGGGVFEESLQRITGYGTEAGTRGSDYYMNDASNLTRSIINLALQRCDASVQIHKQVETDPLDVTPGGEVTYTVTARGTGQIASTSVNVYDLEGANIAPGSATFSSPSKGEIVDGVWNVGELEVAEEQTVTVTARVADEWVPGTDIVNDVTVTSDRFPDQVTEGETNDSAEADTDRWDSDAITTAAADVKVNKDFTGSAEDITPGSQISYRIEVKNASTDVRALNVVAEDIAGPGLTVDSIAIEDGSHGTISGSEWTIGTLEPEQSVTAVVTATIAEDFEAGSDIINDVIVNALGDPYEDGNTPNETVDEDDDNFDREVITAPASALKTNKEIDTAIEDLAPGEGVDYTITVKNDGPDAASGVVVTERPGAGFEEGTVEFIDGSQTHGTFDGLTWNVGTLGAGETATIKVHGVLADDVTDAETITNVVSAENPWNPPSDGECVENTDGIDSDTDQCDVVIVTPPSSLQVDKAFTADAIAVQPGGEVTYELTARNSGKFATEDVTVEDHALAGIDPESVVLSEPTVGEAEGSVWNVGSLAPGQVETVLVTANLLEATDVDSFVNATTIGNPNNPAPEDPAEECIENENGVETDTDQCDIVTVETPNAPLQLAKELNTAPGDIAAGGNGTYTVTVKNASEDRSAAGIVMTDLPADGLVPESIVLSDPSHGEIAEDGTWLVGTLEPGQEVTVTVVGTFVEDLSERDQIVNAAEVENPWNPRGDSENPNDSVDEDDDQWDEARTEVPDALLKVRKQITSDPVLAVPGGAVTYEVEAANDSNAAANDVVITDLPMMGIDPGSIALTFNGETVEDADPETEGFQWAVGRMTANQRVTATVTATLTEDALEYQNGVTVENPNHPTPGTPGECQPNNSDVMADEDQCDFTENAIPQGELKVDKAITTEAGPGGEIIYTLTAKNVGPEALAEILVTDTPMEGLVEDSLVLTDPSIGEVDGTAWNVGTLEPGQEATATVTATIAEGVEGTAIRNGVHIENPQNPAVTTPGSGVCEMNEGVDADTDQCDVVELTIPVPPAPVPPAPSTPVAPTPANDGGNQAAVDNAAGGNAAATGGDAGKGGLLAGALALLAGLGIGGGVLRHRRIGKGLTE